MNTDDVFQEVAFRGMAALRHIAQLRDSRTGESLLHVAIAYKNSEVFDELLRRGCDVTSVNKRGESPLHYAAAHKQVQMGEKLIERGASLGLGDSLNITPMSVAVLSSLGRDYGFVEMLAKHGGGRFLGIKNIVGNSAQDIVDTDPRLQEIFQQAPEQSGET
jgi:ankyrin repeat protein